MCRLDIERNAMAEFKKELEEKMYEIHLDFAVKQPTRIIITN